VQTVKTPGDISDGGYNAAIIVPASRRRARTAGGERGAVDTLGFLSTAAFRRGTRVYIGEMPIIFIAIAFISRFMLLAWHNRYRRTR